jgi:hypothetical protein
VGKTGFLRAGASAFVACILACDDDPQSHVYVAAPYAAATNCFGPSASLAEVDTGDGSLDCAPTCLLTTAPDGTPLVYVSSMCGPYPAGFDSTQSSPLCAAPLAAWPAEAAALADGTDSCAEGPEDASTPADAAATNGDATESRDE